MRKFSRLRPVMTSPPEVVAATSIVTTGTSTEMETPPACDCGCWVVPDGGACYGDWPGCGLGGACASTRKALRPRNKLAVSTPAAILFILSPIPDKPEIRICANGTGPWSLGTLLRRHGLSAYPRMLV